MHSVSLQKIEGFQINSMTFLVLKIIAQQPIHNGPTQLLNCQWNSCDIDDCQMLKYQSSQSYKVLHLLDLSF